MALFNAIPYNYLPTASRLKNSIPRHESTQKKFTPNDTAVVAAADDEGYKPTFSEIDSVGHRDHNLESPIVENLQYTILKKNIESKNSILKNRSMILEDEEVNDSNLMSASTPIDAGLGLSKPIQHTGHEVRYNIENDGFRKDDNIFPL
ncbi:uncharacterized protein EAE97_000654 [Botrytis byssoidea]|uniref:Uncharacterized protein n=1 Tax=Botrytis byssoidea TaxID=139641 RepID=A0A9P5M8X6_9HELO|nr:uncharacterized protein EAE97_000654 [Botrytis byssoidea]KAF7955395.1 hypothetical protein EAE97_000654 [Botrytis byssoidea]